MAGRAKDLNDLGAMNASPISKNPPLDPISGDTSFYKNRAARSKVDPVALRAQSFDG